MLDFVIHDGDVQCCMKYRAAAFHIRLVVANATLNSVLARLHATRRLVALAELSSQRSGLICKIVNLNTSRHLAHVNRNRSKIKLGAMEVLTMGNQLEKLEAEAMMLTSGERAAFAQVLLASLDEDAEIEEAWASEVERRIADVESGVVQVIPIAEALAQVRAALK